MTRLSIRGSSVPLALLAAGLLGTAPTAPRAADPTIAIVLCAPGYPGSTTEAAATMGAFARFAGRAARLPEGRLVAEYHESEQAGLARLAKPDAALAFVTLPFYAKQRDAAGLAARLKAVGGSGADEVFGLVARRGSLASPSALEGWEIVGVPGFAPDFVRDVILGAWGSLPKSVPIRFTSRVPSALIRTASGEKVAVLVDGEQIQALPSDPRFAELEIVARSKPLPASVVCTLGARSKGPEVEAILAALARLHRIEGGAEVLKSMRLERFEAVPAGVLERELGPKRPEAGALQ